MKAGASIRSFWPVRNQYPIEKSDFRSHLDHFASFGVVGAFR
jgi:hypothetical protein